MKKIILIAVCLFALLGFNADAQRKITIKLASMVPENTEWGAALNKMAAEWSKATGGEVTLQIYANGTQGSEDTVLQKLRMNSIQAAVLTSFGLHKVVPEIMTLSCPFLIRTDDELKEVLKNMNIEGQINATKEYQALAVVRGGWVKFFSKDPIFVPADLKRQKIGSSPSEPALTQAYRTMEYQVVEVEQSETLLALQSNKINAIYQSPLAAAGFQLFGAAKNMASINIAPFMGGIILNKRTWESIPEKYRGDLLRISRRIGIEFETSMLRLENNAIREMSRYGLVINNISPQQAQLWYDDMNRVTPRLLGTTFDRATYNRVDAILKTYRGRQ